MGLFDGKTAIVTGAGQGVGRAEAMLLAEEGASVVVNDLGASIGGDSRNAKVADEVVAEIKEAGGTSVANYSDISELEGVDALVWTAMSKFGRLDVMINNAGILRDKMMLNMSEAKWDSVLKVHAKGTFLCSRAAGRIMKAQGTGGAIVNTTSISGMAGNLGQSNYGAAKTGIYSLTKINAMEFARAGIRVNCVCPSGYTRMVSNIIEMSDEYAQAYSSVIPTARLAVFLASDLAKDITGRVMGSHGGSKKNRVTEYKMMVSEGLQKDDGMFTIQELADNMEKILFEEPDITITSDKPTGLPPKQ